MTVRCRHGLFAFSPSPSMGVEGGGSGIKERACMKKRKRKSAIANERASWMPLKIQLT